MPINPSDCVPTRLAALIRAKGDPKKRTEHVFLTATPGVLDNKPEVWADIKRGIAVAFSVPIQSVFVCGSGMLGYSFAKAKPFEEGVSDLDIAILDPKLFVELLEDAHSVTNGFQDQTKFGRISGQNTFSLLSDGIVKHGMIYLRYMPRSPKLIQVESAIKLIRNRHTSIFGDLTCAVYASQNMFISKQVQIVEMAGRLI